MRKKLGLGAGFALTAAVIAIGGCGSKKTTNITGSSGELNNNGFPASSISQNNLAADGGGFSENNQTASFGQFTCKFNFKHANSEAASTADNSGMFFFVTSDNNSTPPAGRQHVFVSYWNGSSFTPPQEITGEDRDERATGAQGVHAGSVILMPMNTSGYGGTGGTANARVRANQGNWLIVWDCNTFQKSSQLTGLSPGGATTTAGVLVGSATGPHHAVYMTVFIKNLASQPLANTNLIGNTAASGTANGPSIECHNGIQYLASLLSTYRNGASNPGVTYAHTEGFVDNTGADIKPAEDIPVFGMASDTMVGCAKFASNTQDLGGLTGPRLGNANGGQFHYGPNTSGPNSTATVSDAQYDVGDSTTFIQMFWVQLVTSGTGLTRTQTSFGTPSASVELGPQYSLLTNNFNLATMTIGGAATPYQAPDAATQSVVAFPATRNTFTDARRSSAQPQGTLVAYNNILFWNYTDTSLAVPFTAGSGVGEGAILQRTNALSGIAILPGVNGDATIGNQNDVTLLGTNGKHQILNDTTNVVGGIQVGDESVNLGLCNGCGIIGPDEGQTDIVAFVLGKITTENSRGGGTANDTDTQLWAVAFQSTGATAGQLQAFTNNPKRISTHTPDLTATSQGATGAAAFPGGANDTSFRDSVQDAKQQLSRDGTYSVLAWRQVQGTSINANLALNATVYKVFRNTAVNGSATSTTVPTLDQRFPTATPITVNTPSTVAYTGQTITQLVGGYSGSPVAAYDFQGHISYRCGFQGDRTKMAIVWLYSDGTEDRIFIKLLTIGTGTAVTDAPTITATNEAEVDATAAVPGQGVSLPGGTTKATFRFIPSSFGETIPTYSSVNGAGNVTCGSTLTKFSQTGNDALDTLDAGVNTANGGGDVLLVFSKVVAATANNWDKQVIASLYNQTTISDRVVISRNFVENTSVTNPNGFKTVFHGMLPNTSSASLQTAARSPDNGAYIYMGAPTSVNNSSSMGLFTRHWRARKATGSGTAVTFPNNFFPVASAATTDATFKNPVRIDNGTNNSDAKPVFEPLHKGRQAVVVFTQDNHLWGTVTSDGESYTSNGGQPDAFLVDNNISAATNFGRPAIDQHACLLFDSNCDDLSKTALFFLKEDVNGNQRFYVRSMN